MRGIGVMVLVMSVVAACAIITSPPRDLVEKNDHVALAAWYDKEAAHLRQHAKDLEAMAQTYEQNPGPTTRGVEPPKIDFASHARAEALLYLKAAEEADALAKGHRSMVK